MNHSSTASSGEPSPTVRSRKVGPGYFFDISKPRNKIIILFGILYLIAVVLVSVFNLDNAVSGSNSTIGDASQRVTTATTASSATRPPPQGAAKTGGSPGGPGGGGTGGAGH